MPISFHEVLSCFERGIIRKCYLQYCVGLLRQNYTVHDDSRMSTSVWGEGVLSVRSSQGQCCRESPQERWWWKVDSVLISTTGQQSEVGGLVNGLSNAVWPIKPTSNVQSDSNLSQYLIRRCFIPFLTCTHHNQNVTFRNMISEPDVGEPGSSC